MAEPLAVEAHQVDRRQVGLRLDPPLPQALHHPLAVHPGRNLDHVHEPAPAVAARIRAGERQALDPPERLAVQRRDRGPPGEQVVEPFELRDAQRAGDLGEAVVEAQAIVVEPAHVRGTPLVALGVDPLLVGVDRAHHHAALTGGHLLVGVEGEDR